VLFSRPDVSSFINQNFEPVWESVRPVPTVTIDFGNGTVVTRTLHGNIATYLCTADGCVIDILPGVYEPATYLDFLDQIRSVAADVLGPAAATRDEYLMNYHARKAQTVRNGLQVHGAAGAIDSPIDDLARWDLIIKDTYLNETIRHRQVHDWLAKQSSVMPDQAKSWLYREVLHADLDDPYLGLRKTLFDGYPFED
jgi:hypothetical protein